MGGRGERGAQTVHPSVAGALLATADPGRWMPNAYIQAVAHRGTSISPDEGRTAYQLDAADITGRIEQQVIEALVSAVAHRDYAIYGAEIRLRVFADRLKIMSPGALANTMTLESLPFGQAARNEVLASLLARCPIPPNTPTFETTRETLMDKRGEGVCIILERSERLSGRRPEYRVLDNMKVS